MTNAHRQFNKKKIINDPVYGFVTIPSDLIYDLIEHPYFQRLRRIKQLGLSNWVYPGALHTRFQHVIGAMSLTAQAVDLLRWKGVIISDEEKDAVCAAVLLHDMGHGPYSHTLEAVLIKDVDHESISLAFMQQLNIEMNGRLDMAISIFTNKYPRKFLHQLVSSQLDMDRLDYLRRDKLKAKIENRLIRAEHITENTIEKKYQEAELVQILYERINQLPDRMQQVFKLTYLDGYSRAEIAQMLNLSENTVRNTNAAAMKALRLTLSAEQLLILISLAGSLQMAN